MIPYTQSAASQEVPPPYHFPGVTVNAFVWEVQTQQVQKYCDTYFNLGTAKERGFVYKSVPFWPYATLMFLKYPVMVSSGDVRQSIGQEPQYSDRGIVSQTEVFVAFPMMRYGTTPTRFLLDTNLEWALPFIVVGNSMSAVCGREMLGLGKLLADIDTSEGDYPGSFAGCVDLPGWPTPSPSAMQQQQRFLEVATAPTLPDFHGSPPSSSLWSLFQSRAAGRGFAGAASIADFVDDLSVGSAPTVMRTISLKQFRDAAFPKEALFQALISCRSRYDNIRDFSFYNENDVTINFYDTGSFADILRVFLNLPRDVTGQAHPVKAKAACRFTADIDFDELRTIHTFAVDRGRDLAGVPASSDLTSPWLRPLAGFFGPRSV